VKKCKLAALALGTACAAALVVGCRAAPAAAQGPAAPAIMPAAQLKPGPRDLCPVCGMLVSKYPNWTAVALYRDGHAHYFDGPKDLFKYLNNLARFAPGHRAEDLATLYVTEFYGLTRIDARRAYYVVGSDVLGPMGNELLPLDAGKFD